MSTERGGQLPQGVWAVDGENNLSGFSSLPMCANTCLGFNR